jgi:hypothetical protein
MALRAWRASGAKAPVGFVGFVGSGSWVGRVGWVSVMVKVSGWWWLS